jgi:hypothetical protein
MASTVRGPLQQPPAPPLPPVPHHHAYTPVTDGYSMCGDMAALRTETAALSKQVNQLRQTVLRLETKVASELTSLHEKLDTLLRRSAQPATSGLSVSSSPAPLSSHLGSPSSVGSKSPSVSLPRTSPLPLQPRRPSVAVSSALRRESSAMDHFNRRTYSVDGGLPSPGNGSTAMWSGGTASGYAGAPIEVLQGRKLALWVGSWNVGAKVGRYPFAARQSHVPASDVW